MTKKKDLTGGDHSFKNWFKIMKENNYITIAVIALSAIIYEFWNLEEIIQFISESATTTGIIMVSILILIPWGMLTIVSIKGFYQTWNNLKNKKTNV